MLLSAVCLWATCHPQTVAGKRYSQLFSCSSVLERHRGVLSLGLLSTGGYVAVILNFPREN